MDLSAFNALLFSIHSLIAVALKAPEIALTEIESEQLANAAANVARHYNIGASQKALDWGNLAIVLGAVYGPRLFVISKKSKPKQAETQDFFVPIDLTAGIGNPGNGAHP